MALTMFHYNRYTSTHYILKSSARLLTPPYLAMSFEPAKTQIPSTLPAASFPITPLSPEALTVAISIRDFIISRGLITKPFTNKQLLEAIKQCLADLSEDDLNKVALYFNPSWDTFDHPFDPQLLQDLILATEEALTKLSNDYPVPMGGFVGGPFFHIGWARHLWYFHVNNLATIIGLSYFKPTGDELIKLLTLQVFIAWTYLPQGNHQKDSQRAQFLDKWHKSPVCIGLNSVFLKAPKDILRGLKTLLASLQKMLPALKFKLNKKK